MNDTDREKFLLDWTTAKCTDDCIEPLDFEEGWKMVKLYGLDVLSEMLKNFLLNKDGKGREERLV